MSKEQMSAYFKAMGEKGGKARAAKLSQERRIEIARKAGKARKKTKGEPCLS